MKQDSFDQKKKSILEEIATNSDQLPDASPKGTIDELCIPIIQLINTHKDLVTTSSCSGRVSVFLEGSKIKNLKFTENNHQDNDKLILDIETPDSNNIKIGGKGEGGKWLFVTHDKAELKNWYKDLNFKFLNDNNNNNEEIINDSLVKRYILFKFEPLILHIKCRNFEAASNVYKIAMSCGFRESGIGTNNLLGVRISIKLDIPIGYLNESNNELELFVDENYLKIVTQLSIDRFNENTKKLDMLYSAIKSFITTDTQNSISATTPETKEARRERKKREGLRKKLGKPATTAVDNAHQRVSTYKDA
ncbi:tRNA methyltransferase TYW3 [Ascoidea rubescens DSM 1968]|uniref:tRNA wybutosine-synthesizing protein 3 n=1 Tax=Ascoidea rubescens DSM 1968 TaxID=1344418 RepID=A0A1D2VH02_9ASCO|nr:TYW3-domain-containing protein [Ascoidea rubescens DSM 1968]ODV60938.1 TYW3-domain-containing protein [Ascoidea rubescens DSM 1968]